MGDMGFGYGSKWHLLRYLGYHRAELTRRVIEVTGETAGFDIHWLDFQCGGKSDQPVPDLEWKGLDFLPPSHRVRDEWKQWWPQGSGIQNWDAVGRIGDGDNASWILIEAKAHVTELQSDCKATSEVSLGKIKSALCETRVAMGVPGSDDAWLRRYYQYANHLAVTHFLNKKGVRASLVNIYFTGDRFKNSGNECPADQQGWHQALTEMQNHLGFTEPTKKNGRDFRLFLPVCPVK